MDAQGEVTISLFHPAVWGVVAVIIVPLAGLLIAVVTYQIRQLDNRVLRLVQTVSRLEGVITTLGADGYRLGVAEPPVPILRPDDEDDDRC